MVDMIFAQPSLIGVPVEIRLRIYDFLLEADQLIEIDVWSGKTVQWPQALAMLHISKQIRAEVSSCLEVTLRLGMDYVDSPPTARARKLIAKMALTVTNSIKKMTSRLRYGRLIDFRNKDKNPIVKMTPSVASCITKIVLSGEAGFMPDYVKKRFYPRLKVVVIEKLCYLEPHLEEMYERYPHSIHCLVTIALGVPWRTIQVTNEVVVKAIKRATDKLTTNTIPSEKNRGFEVLCQADITLFLRTIGPNTIGTSLYARRRIAWNHDTNEIVEPQIHCSSKARLEW